MAKITLNSLSFEAPDKFKAGERLSVSDAKVLNYLWREKAERELKKYLLLFPFASKADLELQLEFVTLNSGPSNLELQIEVARTRSRKTSKTYRSRRCSIQISLCKAFGSGKNIRPL